MNRYGEMALGHNRRHRPDGYSRIPDPEAFFAEAGEEFAAEVTRLRDEILGPMRGGDSPETYRLRSYQALAMAEELTLADHHLFHAQPASEMDEGWSDDPDLERRYRILAEINQAIHTPL